MSILELTEVTQSTEICHLSQKFISKEKPLLSRDKHICAMWPQTYVIKIKISFFKMYFILWRPSKRHIKANAQHVWVAKNSTNAFKESLFSSMDTPASGTSIFNTKIYRGHAWGLSFITPAKERPKLVD